MSETPQIISGLSEIAGEYDALLCDVWGVVHDGHSCFQMSVAALQKFRETCGQVILLTNSPRPGSEIPGQFASLGVPMDCQDAIVTSGDATRAALKARAPGPVFILGPDRDQPLYDGMGLEEAPLEEAAFVSCTGMVDDRHETPEQYMGMMRRILARSLPFVCANPDIFIYVGGQKVWCSGALAAIYARMGGEVIVAGKPHPAIYQLAFAKLNQLVGKDLSKSRILAIGDGMRTDVKGAEENGVDCMFVASGIHQNALTEMGGLDMAHLQADLAHEKTRVRFAAPGLVW